MWGEKKKKKKKRPANAPAAFLDMEPQQSQKQCTRFRQATSAGQLSSPDCLG